MWRDVERCEKKRCCQIPPTLDQIERRLKQPLVLWRDLLVDTTVVDYARRFDEYGKPIALIFRNTFCQIRQCSFGYRLKFCGDCSTLITVQLHGMHTAARHLEKAYWELNQTGSWEFGVQPSLVYSENMRL